MPRCPRCNVLAKPVTYEGARARMCEECGGYFIDPQHLKRVIQTREVQMPPAVQEKFIQLADASNTTQKIRCDACCKEMVKEAFRDWDDIIIDRCPQCGIIWLDPGELEKIQIYCEYLQDHPDPQLQDVQARKALLLAEFDRRKSNLKQLEERAKRWRTRTRFGMLGYLSDLFS